MLRQQERVIHDLEISTFSIDNADDENDADLTYASDFETPNPFSILSNNDFTVSENMDSGKCKTTNYVNESTLCSNNLDTAIKLNSQRYMPICEKCPTNVSSMSGYCGIGLCGIEDC